MSVNPVLFNKRLQASHLHLGKMKKNTNTFIKDGIYISIESEHMHGSEFLDEINENMDFNLNGYLGDVILGSSYIDGKKSFYNKIMTDKYYKNYASEDWINDD